jgi:arginine kinase
LNAPDFPEDEAKMIVSTRIRVGRNLAEFPLGPALSAEQRAKIEETVTTALNTFDGDLEGKYYSLSSLSDADRN